MTSTEPLAKDIQDLKMKLDAVRSYNYDLLLSLRGACDAYLQGVISPKELQSALSINYLQLELGTILKQYSAIIEKKCPNT